MANARWWGGHKCRPRSEWCPGTALAAIARARVRPVNKCGHSLKWTTAIYTSQYIHTKPGKKAAIYCTKTEIIRVMCWRRFWLPDITSRSYICNHCQMAKNLLVIASGSTTRAIHQFEAALNRKARLRKFELVAFIYLYKSFGFFIHFSKSKFWHGSAGTPNASRAA